MTVGEEVWRHHRSDTEGCRDDWRQWDEQVARPQTALPLRRPLTGEMATRFQLANPAILGRLGLFRCRAYNNRQRDAVPVICRVAPHGVDGRRGLLRAALSGRPVPCHGIRHALVMPHASWPAARAALRWSPCGTVVRTAETRLVRQSYIILNHARDIMQRTVI